MRIRRGAAAVIGQKSRHMPLRSNRTDPPGSVDSTRGKAAGNSPGAESQKTCRLTVVRCFGLKQTGGFRESVAAMLGYTRRMARPWLPADAYDHPCLLPGRMHDFARPGRKVSIDEVFFPGELPPPCP